MGRVDAADLGLDGAEEQLIAEDLDRTTGRAGAAADESDKEKHRHGDRAPELVVGRGIARPGDDRGDVEERLAETLFEAGVAGGEAEDGEREDQRGEHAGEGTHLTVGKERTGAAGHELNVADEGQACEDHEDGGHVFRRAFEAAKREVGGREAARRDGGEGVVQRVEDIHADADIGGHAKNSQEDVDDRNAAGDLGRARQDLACGVEAFGAEDLHAADAEFRQKGHGDDDNPDTAEPLHHGAPEQQTFRQVVEADEDGGPGGGQA